MEARVVAKVEGPKFYYPEIGTCFIKVQSFPLPSEPLYLVGTATAAGMNPAEAIRMEEVSNGLYYTWKGNLTQGDFKFISNRESMLPSLNKGKDNQTLVERKTESDPDTWFTIEADEPEGIYAINLYRKDMTIDFQYVPFEMYI
ncbi:MAG: SusF/SusE family outer membrane protein [Tannerellaceae bacterium]|nr:SusF/SusE family outer membrane protein [Tannerellaceae bacterium]